MDGRLQRWDAQAILSRESLRPEWLSCACAGHAHAGACLPEPRAVLCLQVFRYSTTLEKHKLFISGLPFSCTKEELEDICKAHGTVKDLRLVTNRAGKPKVSGDGGLGSV